MQQEGSCAVRKRSKFSRARNAARSDSRAVARPGTKATQTPAQYSENCPSLATPHPDLIETVERHDFVFIRMIVHHICSFEVFIETDNRRFLDF